jgi:hypothetical protein
MRRDWYYGFVFAPSGGPVLVRLEKFLPPGFLGVCYVSDVLGTKKDTGRSLRPPRDSPDNNADYRNTQEHSDPHAGLENISNQLTASEAYNRRN